MGKSITDHFTPEQRLFLDQLRTYPTILSTFYLTGGTALSACYFNHRLSEDIDMFSPAKFDQTLVTHAMSKVSKRISSHMEFTRIEDSLQYTLTFPSKKYLKVDFVPYLFRQLESPNEISGLKVDSIEDISVNKLLAISQRTASKDYVDLFFILKKYTLWDLRLGVEHKFGMEIEPFYIASLLKNVDQLTTLPIMKKNLTLKELKTFFLAEARRLALPMIKP